MTDSEEVMRVIKLEAKLFASILGRGGVMDKMVMNLWGELVCDDERMLDIFPYSCGGISG
jgi:hypothetical protein